jgi:hypothetical protein
MTWLRPWLKYANYNEIQAEAERRGMFPGTLAPATIYGEVGGVELSELLPKKYIIDSKEYYTRAYLWDRTYYLTTVDQVKKFLMWNLIDKKEYVDDHYDCDNFAISLFGDIIEWTPGLCAGFFITTDHAKNLVVCSDRKVYEIEPQSDVINELTSPCSLYMF